MVGAGPLTAHRRGRIAYRDADGAEVGREWFDLCRVPGGHLLRALCVIDGEDLVRDVSVALDSQWRPRDGWSRVMRSGQGDDALWFRARDGEVLVDSRIGGEDQPQARVRVAGRLPYLGLHPLQGDALVAMARGRDVPGTFRAVPSLTNSISPSGDEAPGARSLDIMAAFVGEEDLTVPAGTFRADRFALVWRADWPPADLWVLAGDCLFLKMTWPLVPGDYVLSALSDA